MAEYIAKRNPNRCPSHPGALLRETLESVSISKADIAEAIGISRQHLYDLLNAKKPVSAQVAVRLGKLLGNGPEVWLRMQTAFDLWRAERETDTSSIDPAIIFRDQPGKDDGRIKLRRPEIATSGGSMNSSGSIKVISSQGLLSSKLATRKTKAPGIKAAPKTRA